MTQDLLPHRLGGRSSCPHRQLPPGRTRRVRRPPQLRLPPHLRRPAGTATARPVRFPTAGILLQSAVPAGIFTAFSRVIAAPPSLFAAPPRVVVIRMYQRCSQPGCRTRSDATASAAGSPLPTPLEVYFGQGQRQRCRCFSAGLPESGKRRGIDGWPQRGPRRHPAGALAPAELAPTLGARLTGAAAARVPSELGGQRGVYEQCG